MIRLTLIYVTFLALAAGVIFLRPSSDVVEEVSPRIASASPEAAKLMEAQPPVLRKVVKTTKPAPRPASDETTTMAEASEMRTLTTGILASLGADPLPEAPVSGDQIALKSLTRPGEAVSTVQATRNEEGTLVISLVQPVSAPAAAPIVTDNDTAEDAAKPIVSLTPALPGASSPTATVAPAPSPRRILAQEKTYKVKRGDSLASISIRYYGNKDGWERIFEANKDKLKNPEVIRVGQELVIPPNG